jgi:hypothetical protein
MEPKEFRHRKQQRIFLCMSILFFINWTWYCLHLITTWRTMNQYMHLDSSSLAVFSLGLWQLLLKERVSGFAMMMATFAFAAATNLILHMF